MIIFNNIEGKVEFRTDAACYSCAEGPLYRTGAICPLELLAKGIPRAEIGARVIELCYHADSFGSVRVLEGATVLPAPAPQVKA